MNGLSLMVHDRQCHTWANNTPKSTILKTYLLVSVILQEIGKTHPMINGPRPAPISLTYLDLIAASVGPGISNTIVDDRRKERG
jgi:hypothetical protein